MDPDIVSTMQARIITSISRSAVMVLSTSINRRLSPYFTTTELTLVLLCIHTLLNSIRTIPGFNASWKTLRDLMQFLMVQALASYVASGAAESKTDPTTALNMTALNLILVLIAIECLPAAGGWMGDDLESFTTSVSYIFSDRISAILNALNIPLFGAALSLCLGGKGLLGRTLAFVGINTLSSLAFESISGRELSFAWPVTLLYFVHELSSRYNVDTFFSFGLYRASDSIYAGFSAMGVAPSTVCMAFIFLGSLSSSDPVWAGICVLVFVQGGSDWFLKQLAVISATDPFLGMLCLVTAVHFISTAVERTRLKE